MCTYTISQALCIKTITLWENMSQLQCIIYVEKTDTGADIWYS